LKRGNDKEDSNLQFNLDLLSLIRLWKEQEKPTLMHYGSKG